jgi:hypothetical protein
LWSDVSATAATAPACLRPSTARESPKLPTWRTRGGGRGEGVEGVTRGSKKGVWRLHASSDVL